MLIKKTMKIKKICVLTFLLIFPNIYSQITTTKFEEKLETEIEKNNPLDSLENFKILSNLKDNRKYIGQQLFIPQKNSSTKIFRENDFLTPYLFSTNFTNFIPDKENTYNEISNTVRINNQNEKERILNTFTFSPKNINESYHRTLIIDSVKTSIYNPYFYFGKFDFYNNTYDFRFTNSDEISNKYYTIIDVIYGEKLKAFDFKTIYFYKLINKSSKKPEILKKKYPTKIMEILKLFSC